MLASTSCRSSSATARVGSSTCSMDSRSAAFQVAYSSGTYRMRLGEVADETRDAHGADVGDHHLVASEGPRVERRLMGPDVEPGVGVRVRLLSDRLLRGPAEQATGHLALEDVDDHRPIQRGHG